MKRESHVNLQQAVIFSSCLLAGIWTSFDAEAGKKYNTEVIVSTVTSGVRAARGSVGAARNSSDTVQAIGCTVSSNGGAVVGACFARDASNQYAGCSTTDYDLLEVIKAQTASSYIDFRTRADGSCDTITIWNDSYEPPKLP